MSVFVPPRHHATAAAWAWLQSQPIEEMTQERRDKIAATLMELDEELHRLDAALAERESRLG